MALTGRVVFSSYPYPLNGSQKNSIMGRSENLPSALVRFYAAPAGTTAGNNVEINSIVELLPSGLRTDSQRFFTDSTVTELGTNGS